MNLLAHQLLSKNETELAIGNFIADAVKGKQYLNYSEGIQNGILLHRRIDFFMDHNEITIKGMKRLRADFSKYSTVIIDVFYDHFIAKNWEVYHHLSLLDFTQKQYQILLAHIDQIPDRLRMMLHYLEKENWMYEYRKIEGIENALLGISRRIKHDFQLDKSVKILIEHYDEYEAEVSAFMPIISAKIPEWLEEINSSKS
jgi:acyl carrier protein phosphodiesterase